MLINKRSREHAEKARLTIKKKLASRWTWPTGCRSLWTAAPRTWTRRELYIVEGDSALGAVKQGRDAEFQAIMPIRGKILNCLKADYARIFKSDIITDLIKVMGCGVEVRQAQ